MLINGITSFSTVGLYSANELRIAGVMTARELLNAGYNMEDVKKAGE